MPTFKSFQASAFLLTCLVTLAGADEGMWILNAPPTEAIKAAYKVDLSREWLEHMQKSCVRFETGGSGSIVSKDGLVMTNHHVGSDMLLKLSTKENNLLENGFWAPTRDKELACPDLELSVLWEISDVTDAVIASVKEGMSAPQAGTARRKAIARIEKESRDTTGLKSEVVTLYQGGKYHLYRYRSFTDIRLVFAPEETAAFFGGDTDNFEFPRYNLDCCFFRIYEHGKPLQAEHFLSWSQAGANENDPIFVFGHPGRTRRLYTADHLRFLRDVMLPMQLQTLWRSEIKLQGFAGRSAENARIAREAMAGVANSRKAYTGLIAGLQDPVLLAAKIDAENVLRSRVQADTDKDEAWGEAWDMISQAEESYAEFFDRKYAIDRAVAGSFLLKRAMDIVRLADELPKKNEERLKEYTDASLESLYLDLYSPEPVYDSLEAEMLAQGLSRLAELFGGDDELVTRALDGKSPRARAQQLVERCSLKDPGARRKMVESGGVATSQDPMIALAKVLDEESRQLRTDYQDQVESVERDAYAKIAAATFWALGDKTYPDATFTLRLSYGSIKGCDSAPAPFTTLGGMFEREAERHGLPDFVLPRKWQERKAHIKLDTPFNFICTADIIGGNSGSPVVNARGEVVGLIFDGNLDSLVGDVVYDARNSRAVAVDSRGLLEAISSIYQADALVQELRGK